MLKIIIIIIIFSTSFSQLFLTLFEKHIKQFKLSVVNDKN